MDTIDLLLKISEKSGFYGSYKFTTSELGKKLGVSQQSISNALVKLENNKIIKRMPSYSGITISLTDKGRKKLESYHKNLQKILKGKDKITGRVFTGVDQGRFYTEVPGFKRQFISKLGIDTYPGTLNLRVSPIDRKSFLHNKKPVLIDGFKTKTRTFGWIKCYPIFINGINGAITIPERTVHKEDTIEIISKKNLRKELNLKDNNKVTVKWKK